MTLRNRVLARIGAGTLGLVAAGAFAAPALAADSADLEVRATGTTIAAGADGKFGSISLINNGPADATGITITLDISELDTDRVDTDLDMFADSGCSPRENDIIRCGIEEVPAGADVDFYLPLIRADGATGDAGQLTVTVEHAGTDPEPGNNSVTVDVTVGGNGVDLAAIADDVRQEIDLARSTTEPVFTEDVIQPGDTAAVVGAVVNQGDMTADGVKVTVTLPKQVTFAAEEDGCTYSADNRTIACDYDQVTLIPFSKYSGGEDRAAAAFWFPIKVADGVTAPVALRWGTFGAAALAQVEFEEPVSTLSKEAAPRLPANVKLLNGNEIPDVDASDNVDEFSVFVVAEGGSGGGDGDEGGGPTLPVTGVQIGLIGGFGAAVIALGGVLVLLARRRRVVLVTPDDEGPTG